MKTSTPISQIRATAAALALLGTLFWGGTASAAGTASGTTISNLATLSYSVGGVSQPAIGSSLGGNILGAGTATTFVVDNKVNLSVLETGGSVTPVVPGSVDRITTFTVTNLGNTAQGYTLAAANQGVTSNIDGVADTIAFDVTNFRVFVESGANAGFQPSEDNVTFISTLAADATITVYVLADIPVAAVNGNQANVTLTATTKTTGLTLAAANAEIYIETAGADTTGVDIVFADAATVESNFVGASAARNAQGTARDAYRVVSALITVTKTSLLVCDPFNGSGPTRKNIPGAIVRWTITISNTGAASASLATVADTLQTVATTFDANLVTGVGAPATADSCTSASGAPESAPGSGFKIDVTGDQRATTAGVFPRFLTTLVAGNDGASHDGTATGGVVAIDYSVALPAGGAAGAATTYTAGELKTGESVIVYFNVTIQ